MQGKVNFDPAEMDQLVMGNTVEENTALHGIAKPARLDQQLAPKLRRARLMSPCRNEARWRPLRAAFRWTGRNRSNST